VCAALIHVLGGVSVPASASCCCVLIKFAETRMQYACNLHAKRCMQYALCACVL